MGIQRKHVNMFVRESQEGERERTNETIQSHMLCREQLVRIKKSVLKLKKTIAVSGRQADRCFERKELSEKELATEKCELFTCSILWILIETGEQDMNFDVILFC